MFLKLASGTRSLEPVFITRLEWEESRCKVIAEDYDDSGAAPLEVNRWG